MPLFGFLRVRIIVIRKVDRLHLEWVFILLIGSIPRHSLRCPGLLHKGERARQARSHSHHPPDRHPSIFQNDRKLFTKSRGILNRRAPALSRPLRPKRRAPYENSSQSG
jgi:hypothetical protein